MTKLLSKEVLFRQEERKIKEKLRVCGVLCLCCLLACSLITYVAPQLQLRLEAQNQTRDSTTMLGLEDMHRVTDLSARQFDRKALLAMYREGKQ